MIRFASITRSLSLPRLHAKWKTLWAPAIVQAGPGFSGIELGQVLIPAISPLSWQYEEPDVRLGRVTEWVALDDGTEVPVGQKLLLVDGEELPILELRKLEIHDASG